MSPNNSESFGDFIKALRGERGLTLIELADITGYSDAYISQIEKGRRKNPPSLEVLKAFSETLGVPYSRLLISAGYDELGKGQHYLELIEDFSNDPEQDIMRALARIENSIQADKIEQVKYNEEVTEQIVNEKNLYDLNRILKQISKPVTFNTDTLTDDEKELLHGFIELLIKTRKEGE